jgi:hypothetical protein
MITFKQFILESTQLSDKLNEIINLISQRYQPEFKDFLDRMASKDADIRELLIEFDKLNPSEDSGGIYKNSADASDGDENLTNGEN